MKYRKIPLIELLLQWPVIIIQHVVVDYQDNFNRILLLNINFLDINLLNFINKFNKKNNKIIFFSLSKIKSSRFSEHIYLLSES